MLKPLMKAQARFSGNPEGVAEQRTEILATNVRKTECPVISLKYRTDRDLIDRSLSGEAMASPATFHT